MTSIIIKDLSATTELDARAMADVRGGTYKDYCMPSDWKLGEQPKFEPGNFSFNATQQLDQCQNTLVNNGNNVAYASNISANVNPSQSGNNSISFA